MRAYKKWSNWYWYHYADILLCKYKIPLSHRGISVVNNFSGTQDRIGVYSQSINAPGWGYGLQAYGGYFGAYIAGSGR